MKQNMRGIFFHLRSSTLVNFLFLSCTPALCCYPGDKHAILNVTVVMAAVNGVNIGKNGH